MYAAVFAVLLAACLYGQGTPVKQKVSEYPVTAKLPDAEIGAEYMVRSFGEPGQLLIVEDYLVVEVAIFPARREGFLIDLRNFNLRLNGKDTLAAQTPGMVGASLKYSDWTQRPQMTGEAGPVIVGGPQRQPRFPGDNRPERDRRNPPPATGTGIPEKESANPAEIAVNTALPEGLVRFPVSGFVYFPHRGKLNKLKSVELLAGETAIRLR